MLLVAILAILSNEGLLVGIERFARRHREILNELLGTDFGKDRRIRPSDCCSTNWTWLALKPCCASGCRLSEALLMPSTRWCVTA
jgi:hypothetical protein